MFFKLPKELVGILWEKEKAYYCNCRKLISNPQDAERAGESWVEQGDPKLQPASDGIFPNAPCKRDTASATSTEGGKKHPAPQNEGQKEPFFWHHLLELGGRW